MRDDLTFLHGAHRAQCVASVDKRFDYYTLQLMTRGQIRLSYDQSRARHASIDATAQSRELSGPWAWPCRPGPWIRFHEWPRNEPWEHRYIAFTGPRVAAWEADGLWPREPQPVPAESAGELATVFDQLIDLAVPGASRLNTQADSPGRLSQLRAVNLLERILLELAEARHTAPARPAWLDTVMTTLATAGEQPSYEELARSISMSLSTLRRRFRAATGLTLHQYHLQHRVAEARRLLGDTDIPVKQVATQLGYSDVYYFTRQFAQITGVPPATYRRSRQ